MTNNYTDFGIEIISMALDDICPKYRLPDRKIDNVELAAIEEVQKLAAFLHKGHTFLIQERFQNRWDALETGFDSHLNNLITTKHKILTSVRKSDNSNKIDLRLQKAMESWNKRRVYLEKRLKGRKCAFKVKVTSQIDIKFTVAEAVDLKLGLDRSIAREIREFENKRETNLRKIREMRNSARIEEKLIEKEVLYDLRIKHLHESYKRQQDLFNKKWGEEDLQGAAIDWFINDLPQVSYWCTVGNVPLKVCYQGVKERFNMLCYNTKEVDLILQDIKSGKITSESLNPYPFPGKYDSKNNVDSLLNMGYNAVYD